MTNFKCVLGDWGTSYTGFVGERCFGGTPGYAGPRTFETHFKDLFSFGRLALELFLDQEARSESISLQYSCLKVAFSDRR